MNETSAPDNPMLQWQGEAKPLLLRWQEDELNEAEKRLLKAFRGGWKADDWSGVVVVPSEGSSTPEKPAEGHTADDWKDAILRASFLRDLLLGNYGEFDPRLIVISRAWIEGQLDLNYCESRIPLAFSQCIFSDGISLRNAIIPELLLPGCEVRSPLFAQGTKVSTNVFLVDGFKSNDEVNLSGAEIGGEFFCCGHFEKGLNAPDLKTSSDVRMVSLPSSGGKVLVFESKGVVNLSGAEIGGRFICLGLFEEGLYAQGLKTSSDVFMRSNTSPDGQVLAFESKGVVNLSGAEIGGQFVCRGLFEKGLNAQGMKTSSVVFMMSDPSAGGQVLAFESKGAVNLHNAEIGGQFGCRGFFNGGLNAQGLKTISDVHMRSDIGPDGQVLAFESKGEVILSDAEIGGEFCCRGLFEMGLNAQGLKTSSDVSMYSVESNGVVNLRGAEIRGSLDLGNAAIKDVLLDHVEVHGVLVDLQKWPRRGSANGFRYQTIEPDDDWETGRDWVQHMSSSKFSPQPYEQLMSVYRRMGHTNWAREIGFALEKKRSKEFKGWQWLTWRPWYGILKWTIGYGYKPFRFIPWALGLVMTGFLLFSSGHSWQMPTFLSNEWVPSEAEALESQTWKQDRKPPPDYLPFNPLIYSLEATFPVLPLGQLEKWHPSNPCLLIVRWVWSLIGTLLLAILALFGAGVLGPRWRSGDEGG
ncbi:MAG: hypothetical protein OXU78_09260 [Deltaproteobacteria bacterium]|nr:hypothetical protein [Deltaproteobacteria bacterium]